MDPKKVHDLVQKHIDKTVKELKTPNKVWLTARGLGKPWYGNPNGFLFEAGKRATEKIYEISPDLTREGGSIPVTISFQDATQKPVILLPMGSADDGAHSQNEKINVRNYIEGIKLLGTFLQELK
jgi:acetylornithine deacetylase/succinyl-diaminopimelate desuccinylase-like protein